MSEGNMVLTTDILTYYTRRSRVFKGTCLFTGKEKYEETWIIPALNEVFSIEYTHTPSVLNNNMQLLENRLENILLQQYKDKGQDYPRDISKETANSDYWNSTDTALEDVTVQVRYYTEA